MQLSNQKQRILKRAIKLLTPYNKEDISQIKFYFEHDEEDLGSDYECCDQDKCLKKMRDRIKTEHPEWKGKLDERWTYNNGDHEDVERCQICFRPFNEFLTWVREPFCHHREYTVNRRELKKSHNAFEVIAIFQSMPSIDERPSPWAMMNEPKEALQREKDFANEVVAYAELVIKKLSNGTKSSKSNRR